MNIPCQTWRICCPTCPSTDQQLSDVSTWLRAVQMAPQPVSLDQASLALPPGAYTTFRTYQRTRVHHFDAHIERLEESARLAGLVISLQRERIRAALREAIRLYPADEMRVRLTLDLEVEPGRLFISLEPLQVLARENYQLGVKVLIRCMQRDNPKAKLTGFIETASSLRHELPPGVNEILMYEGDGLILEGLSSNFFAVQDGAIYTAEKGVLNGITRSIVLEEAASAGIPVYLTAPRLDHLSHYAEAFITSATRSVLPVVQIGDQIIGNGKPGPVTGLLAERFEARIAREVEEL